MSRRTKYARINELVILVRAMRFDRCGYPMTRDDVSLDPELAQRREEMVNRAAKAMFPEAKLLTASWPVTPVSIEEYKSVLVDVVEIDHRIRTDLEKAATIAILIEKGFGGKERKVYESPIDDKFESKPTPIDVPWKVTSKRFVKTGTRYSASGGYHGYSGEYDYEPAGLADEQTHCIYQLEHEESGKVISTLAHNTERITTI